MKFVGWEIAESYEEWNWSYGWNAAGEGSRENTLGTVPAQENPDDLSRRGEINWTRENVIYIPLKEHEIVAPSVMFIVRDRARWRRYVIESGRGAKFSLFNIVLIRQLGFRFLTVMGRRRT